MDKDDFEACESAIAAAEGAFERGMEAAKEAGRQEVLNSIQSMLDMALLNEAGPHDNDQEAALSGERDFAFRTVKKWLARLEDKP